MKNNAMTRASSLTKGGRNKTETSAIGFYFRVWTMAFCAVLSGSVNVRAQENIHGIQDGLVIHFGSAEVELAAANEDALRLSVIHDHCPKPASSFLIPANDDKAVTWGEIRTGDWVGVTNKSGSLLMDPKTGEWLLQNAAGQVIIPQHKIGDLDQSATNDRVKITLGWDKNLPIEIYGSGNGVICLVQREV